MPWQGMDVKLILLPRLGVAGKPVDTRSTFRAFGITQPVYQSVLLTQRNIVVLIIKGKFAPLKAFLRLRHTRKRHLFFAVC